MRLDRLLALLGEGTRSQVRGAVRDGRVTVNGAVAHDAGMRVDAAASRVCMDGRELSYRRVRHVMMNKPQGVLTAARDRSAQTVMDLLPPMYAAMGCMPAGRLDKDTEGLLILTSDGQLAHRLLSQMCIRDRARPQRDRGRRTWRRQLQPGRREKNVF